MLPALASIVPLGRTMNWKSESSDPLRVPLHDPSTLMWKVTVWPVKFPRNVRLSPKLELPNWNEVGVIVEAMASGTNP